MQNTGETMPIQPDGSAAPQVSHQVEVLTAKPPVGGDKIYVSVPIHGGLKSGDNPAYRELSASERGMSEFLNEDTLAQTIEEAFRNSQRYQNAIVGESITHDQERIAKFKENFEEKIKILSRWFVDGLKKERFDVNSVMKVDAEKFMARLVSTREAHEFFADVFATDEEKREGNKYDYEGAWKEELSLFISDFSDEKSLYSPSLKSERTAETVYNYDAMKNEIISQLPTADEETLLKIYKLLRPQEASSN